MAKPLGLQGNEVLADILACTGEGLIPDLERVRLARGKVLREHKAANRTIWFPLDALVSQVYLMESGASAESAMVGDDGMVGIALFMGGDSTLYRTVVQVPGSAYRLSGAVLMHEFERSRPVHDVILRYSLSLFTQMAQTAACSQYHTINQRLCRWLLMALDRLPSPEVAVTQEGIALLLGVRRESVVEAASALRDAGIIRYARGRITVLDRAGLEERACECYAVVRKEIGRLRALRYPARTLGAQWERSPLPPAILPGLGERRSFLGRRGIRERRRRRSAGIERRGTGERRHQRKIFSFPERRLSSERRLAAVS